VPLPKLLEVRSYESTHVGGLWHLDFHHGSVKVVDDKGKWHTPILLGIFDDHSRLCCHMQWYLGETAENLCHGFSQALQKRGIPREVLHDRGSAMISAEFSEGLTALSVVQRMTMPYAPWMNGKCEFVWSRIEARLLSMLMGYKDLTLQMLNETTQAWVEMEYNRTVHRETKERPVDRFVNGKDVARPTPDSKTLRMAFRMETRRRQRKSDGSISLEGKRYEIPSRLNFLDFVTLKYARWDMGYVHIIDERSGNPICRIYPVDLSQNADGRRRVIADPVDVAPVTETTELPTLMQQLMEDYASSGLLPAYLPKDESKSVKEDANERK